YRTLTDPCHNEPPALVPLKSPAHLQSRVTNLLNNESTRPCQPLRCDPRSPPAPGNEKKHEHPHDEDSGCSFSDSACPGFRRSGKLVLNFFRSHWRKLQVRDCVGHVHFEYHPADQLVARLALHRPARRRVGANFTYRNKNR